MIGYNFGLGFMPGPFRFGALSSWLLGGLEASCVKCGPGFVAVSCSLDRP